MQNRRRGLQISKHACDKCRAAKLRCLVDTVAEHGKCRRCYESAKECTFDDMAPRSRRERSDTRLRLLEQELRTLKAKFEGFAQGHVEGSPAVPKSIPEHGFPNPESFEALETLTQQISNEEREFDISFTIPDGEVTSDRCLIPYQQAKYFFNTFVISSLPHYPIISFEDRPILEALRKTKPLLALATITAASRAEDPVLFRQLHLRLSRILAEKVVVQGQRSLEILQALLIAEVWYDPPDDLTRLNFYTWLKLAADLAQQLGLWWDMEVLHAVSNDTANAEQLERWRLALATYLSLSTVSVSLQLPNSILLPTCARETLAKYTITATHINDKKLASWVTLQLMAEEIETLRLRLKEHTQLDEGFRTSLSDLDTRLMLYEDMTLLDGSLQVHYLYVCSKLMELFVQYLTIIVSGQNRTSRLHTKSNRMDYERAIVRLIRASQDLITVVLKMPLGDYLHSPTVSTVRVLYAIHTLRMLHDKNPQPRATDGNVSIHNLVDYQRHVQRLHDFFTKAKGSIGHRIPGMALKAISVVQIHAFQNVHETDQTIRLSTKAAENDLDIVTSPTLLLAEGNADTYDVQNSVNQQIGMTQINLANTSPNLNSNSDFLRDVSPMPLDFTLPESSFWSLLAPYTEAPNSNVWG